MSVADAAGTKLFETLLFCTLGPEEETEALCRGFNGSSQAL